MTTDIPDPDPRVQSPRNAWINALRAEVLRVGTKEMARVGHVGVWLASYGNADGSSCHPGRETLAELAGCTEESVSRLLRVLVGVGMLSPKRRQGKPTVYQLLLPHERPDWDAHMHHYTKTRQRAAHKRSKTELGERAAQEEAARTASMDAVGTASMAGGYQYIPLPAVEDQPNDTTWFGPGPQPQQPARASPLRLAASSPGVVEASSVQPPLLMSAPTDPPAQLPEPDTPDPYAPPRCPDCSVELVLMPSGRTTHPQRCSPNREHDTG